MCIRSTAEPMAQLSSHLSASLHEIPCGGNRRPAVCERGLDKRWSAGSMQPDDQDLAGAPIYDSQEVELPCGHL